MTIKKNPKRSTPPPRRTGKGGGRPVSPELVSAMRVVSNNPDEWFLIAEYGSRGSASSAANRMRARDWDAILALPDGNGHVWDIVSRTYETPKKGAGVWAMRRKGRARAGG